MPLNYTPDKFNQEEQEILDSNNMEQILQLLEKTTDNTKRDLIINKLATL